MIPPELAAFLGAELIFILIRTQDIKTLVKKKHEREPSEQYSVERGLLKSVLLEGMFFTPASAALMLLFAPLIITGLKSWVPIFAQTEVSIYTGLGCLSYGFPFATVQQIITRRALKLLEKYSELTPPQLTERERETNVQNKNQG